jgi:hypothetical protein
VIESVSADLGPGHADAAAVTGTELLFDFFLLSSSTRIRSSGTRRSSSPRPPPLPGSSTREVDDHLLSLAPSTRTEVVTGAKPSSWTTRTSTTPAGRLPT